MRKNERTSFLTGFKLVDYAMGVVCLIVLAFIMMPILARPRPPSRRSHCLNNLRQLVLACHNYQSVHLKFPSASDGAVQNNGPSFVVSLLPFLDCQEVLEEYQAEQRSIDYPGKLAQLSTHRIGGLLLCPVGDANPLLDSFDPPRFGSHYFASLGPNSDPDDVGYRFAYLASQPSARADSNRAATGLSGVFSPWSPEPTDPNIQAEFGHQHGNNFDDIRDGSSNTLAFQESSRSTPQRGYQPGWAFGHLTDPDSANIQFVYSGKSIAYPINGTSQKKPIDSNAWPIASNHSGGAQVAMADGSARFVHEDISLEILRAVSSMDDGQPDDLD